MDTDFDVIVVGGGLAGLTAGATAAAAGASAIVLEAHQFGGRARTVAKGAYTFNMGPHALYLGGAGVPVLRSLGIRPAGMPSPFGSYRILKDDTVHLIPAGPGSLVRTRVMGPASKVQFAKLLGVLPALRPAKLASVSVRRWLDDHSLRPDVEAVVRTLIRLSTYTSDVDSFSAGAAIRQLQIGLRPGVLYLHGGWAQLVDGLAERVRVQARTEVVAVEPGDRRVEVRTADRVLTAHHVVLALGTPAATRALLPDRPAWDELGPPVTAACLDVGVSRAPTPGYLLGADEPIMGVTAGPPARGLAPEGQAAIAALRYEVTNAKDDHEALDAHVRRLGVKPEDIVEERFLARMVVAGTMPKAELGGLEGRPRITDSGHPRLSIAGDWVGPEGLLCDAALASGHAAARQAISSGARNPQLVA
jgi:phytoene dehydrogenase-like protein